MIRQFLVNPKLDYNTFGNSKAKRKFLVFLYKNYYGGRIPYSMPQLEINALGKDSSDTFTVKLQEIEELIKRREIIVKSMVTN